MKKTYVLDTNVLIQAPEALECFEENLVVLPLAVLEELDNLKKADGEKGENARKAIRKLEKFRTMGDLLEGVELPGGGMVRVERNFVDVRLPEELPEEKMDNRILKVCRGKHFQKRAHLRQVSKLGNFFFAFYLGRSIKFPESASGHFGHFYVVGDQPAVHFPQKRQTANG